MHLTVPTDLDGGIPKSMVPIENHHLLATLGTLIDAWGLRGQRMQWFQMLGIYNPDEKKAKKATSSQPQPLFAFLHPSPALLPNHLEHRCWLLSSYSNESLRSSHQVTAVDIP